MDRNAPEALLRHAAAGYDESKALIAKWHGRGRLLYAITPRFAATSSPEQLEAAGALWREHPDCLHADAHRGEPRPRSPGSRSCSPTARGYLDVYDHHGLCGARAVFGHGIWLPRSELQRLHALRRGDRALPDLQLLPGQRRASISTACVKAERPVRVGLGTDIGAGTSFSILATLNEAYKAAQLNRQSLSAGHAYYLATRGTAQAMYLDDKIGSIAPGMEADLVVLDMSSTPIIDFRMSFAQRLRRAALHPDDAGRRPRRAGHLRRRTPGPRPGGKGLQTPVHSVNFAFRPTILWPGRLNRGTLPPVAEGGAYPSEVFVPRRKSDHRWILHRVPCQPHLPPDHRSPTPPLAGAFCFWATGSRSSDQDSGVRIWPNAPHAAPSCTPSIAPVFTTLSSTTLRPTTAIRATSEKSDRGATTNGS